MRARGTEEGGAGCIETCSAPFGRWGFSFVCTHTRTHARAHAASRTLLYIFSLFSRKESIMPRGRVPKTAFDCVILFQSRALQSAPQKQVWGGTQLTKYPGAAQALSNREY